jgi:hypothetical protein
VRPRRSLGNSASSIEQFRFIPGFVLENTDGRGGLGIFLYYTFSPNFDKRPSYSFAITAVAFLTFYSTTTSHCTREVSMPLSDIVRSKFTSQFGDRPL